MRKLAAVLLLAFVAFAALADPVDEVRRAEIAFARAFADRDQAKFFSFVADDATFLPGLRTLVGKQAVVERWSRFFTGGTEAPFSWGPERVVVNKAGTVGLSTGPVFDANGRHVGNYSSIWTKQPDGSWKILYDGPGSDPATFAETAPKTTEGFLTADDGVKLHYRKVGESPIIIIVPLESLLWEDFKQLSDIATVISYDPRNRGRSDHLSDLSSVSVQQDVKDLEAVRKQLNVEKFVPVGFSYLGRMVAQYAAAYPERVTRVVQLGPISIKGEQPRDASAAAPATDCAADWKQTSEWLVADPGHAKRLASPCTLPNEQPAALRLHFARIMASMATDVPAGDLAKIAVPVLTVHGQQDRSAPYAGGREWARVLPNARLVTVPNAAHAAWADDPVIVFGSIREFLRGNWPLTAEKVQ
ncbi:MAG TPA: alpha/beta fold hydrolase [Thermoanaerobaculia bacterium]|jgi:pimeloyl-ACP methyl ester carboxylesterase/ketosteroid isomerase-like protein|nr:alpha/beta fold hydrolase [Thermoanaerobaculia bacterium]